MTYNEANIQKRDVPGAAWLATIWLDDLDPICTAWTTEGASRRWIVNMFRERYGKTRMRMPWKEFSPIGYRKNMSVAWETDGEGNFEGWSN